jgi:beta-phosphoglucomutase
MSRIRLAIFDLDGVITSTTEEHYKAWNLLFQHYYGIKLDSSIESLVKGVSRSDSLKRILAMLKLPLPDEKTFQKYLAYKNSLYLNAIEQFDSRHVLPGVVAVLDELVRNDIKLALGSASRNGSRLLEKIGLSTRFDYIVDPAGLPGKPNPAIFLNAMEHFGFQPDECIGFEDAEAGVEAINAAGMMSIGVGPDQLLDARLKLNVLTELTKNQILTLIEDKNGLPDENGR